MSEHYPGSVALEQTSEGVCLRQYHIVPTHASFADDSVAQLMVFALSLYS